MSKLFNAKKFKEVDIFFSDFEKDMMKNNKSDLGLSINEQAIKQSVFSIINTLQGSVPFMPHFGSGVSHILFQNKNLLQADRLRTRIEQALGAFEPRAEIVEIVVDINNLKENTFDVYITFKTRYNDAIAHTIYINI